MSLRFVPTPLAGGVSKAALEAARDGQSARRLEPAAEGCFLARGAADANLAALLGGDALCVTTGQQPGLFTGPLYSVHKALTAAALAERLAATWGRPVVPVFWVAGDDHDFAEVGSCRVLAADGACETVPLRERPADAPMLPAYREILGAEVGSALARMEALLPPSEFRATVLGWLRASYLPERSLAEAFAGALADLLAPAGVVVLRGWCGELKLAASDVLLGALRRAGELEAALSRRCGELGAAGRESPVEVGKGLALVLVEGAVGRDRLLVEGGAGFVARRSRETFDIQAIEKLLADAPERLSPNVLLRPVVEARALPTVAYVGGPAELAYLAQTEPLFEAFGVPRPAPVPRLSGLLVDGRTLETLERHDLAAEDLARPEGDLESAAARQALPASAAAALEALRRSLEEGFESLARESAAVDPTLREAVGSARNRALAAAGEVERKLLAALKRGEETSLRRLRRARLALYPGGEPQERVYTAASFLSRHGGRVLEVLREAAREHARLLLEAGSPEP